MPKRDRLAEARALVALNRRREAERGYKHVAPEQLATVAARRQYRLTHYRGDVREARFAPSNWEVRNSSAGNIQFSGYASVTCRDFDDDSAAYRMFDPAGLNVESILQNAFKRALQEGCDVCFLVNHAGVSLARTKSGTLKLAEHTTGPTTGLHCEAQLDGANPAVRELMSGIKRGDLDEMSFSFTCRKDR